MKDGERTVMTIKQAGGKRLMYGAQDRKKYFKTEESETGAESARLENV